MSKAITTVQWVPCLLLDVGQLLDESTHYLLRLPGAFNTQREALDAAEKLSCQRLGVIGHSAKRVEVPDGI